MASLFMLLASLLVLVQPQVASAIAPDDSGSIRQEIASILSEGDYQRDWPDLPPPEVTPNPFLEFIAYLLEKLAALFPDQISASANTGDGIQAIAWGLVAIAAIIVISLIVRRLPLRSNREIETETAGDELTPTPLSALEEIEKLARDGRLEEAVHLLLLRFIDDIRQRTRTALQPAMTSREIVAGGALPDDARTSLARVVDSVERSHFGGRPVSRDAFDACLEGYRVFLSGAR